MRLTVPSLGSEEVEAVAAVMSTGYLTQGPVAAEFERLMAQRCRVPFAFATSSCTTALHLTLEAMEIGPGDEVVVPDFTFPATINAVIQCGATPRLADTDPVTHNLDPQRLDEVVTSRTRAIIVVHTFGQCADMTALRRFSDAHGIDLVEDAACAVGASFAGEPAGSLGAVACFSFHPRKVITTGEGGMVTTADPDLAAKIAILRSHGARRLSLFQQFVEPGYNYRLSDINAAVGVVQMSRLDEILLARRSIAAQYERLLASVPGVTSPGCHPDSEPTFQSYVVTLDEGIDRDDVIVRMAAAGIETTLGTYALHREPAYRQFVDDPDRFRNADRSFSTSLTLPLYPAMQPGDPERICDLLAASLADVA